MVAVVIFSDKGEAFCMGKSRESVIDCVHAVTSQKKMQIKYISDTEKRMKYIAKAFETMEDEQ